LFITFCILDICLYIIGFQIIIETYT